MLDLKNKKYKLHRLLAFLFCLVAFLPGNAFALGAEGVPKQSSITNPVAITLTLIMLMLLLIILMLGYIVKSSMNVYRKKHLTGVGGNIYAILITMLLVLGGSSAFAETGATEETAKTVSSTIAGLDPLAFYLMIAVIVAEVIVVLALLFNLKVLLGLEKKESAKSVAAGEAKPRLSWWDKFNSFKPMDEEKTIELDHEYDGIRELDNRLPPWWLYGFYVTIIFAVIYLYRFHVAHSAPLSAEEFSISMKKAEEQKEAYLKKAANSVDENTVKLLTDQKDLDAGKAIFTTICKTCHGDNGQGIVGPNLTDDYWLHGGSINNVFRTIKYGVPEKGMKSWKDDYSPMQIAQLASYIKSLHGTNPPNAKAPQGELYKEDGAAKGADSTKAKVDSTIKK